jgi:hypothetical protein
VFSATSTILPPPEGELTLVIHKQYLNGQGVEFSSGSAMHRNFEITLTYDEYELGETGTYQIGTYNISSDPTAQDSSVSIENLAPGEYTLSEKADTEYNMYGIITPSDTIEWC